MPQSKLYLRKGLQYGATVKDLLWVFAEGAWEEMLATVKIMNSIPFNKLSSAAITAGFKAFRGPTVLGAAGDRLREGVSRRARGLRQPDPVLQLHRPRQVEGRLRLAEAARGGIETTHGCSGGPGSFRARRSVKD